jgi:hypothetical protein
MGIIANFLHFWATFPIFQKFGKNWEKLGKIGQIWERVFGRYFSLGGDRDCAPARYFSPGAMNITGGRSLSSAIMYYNCENRGHCAIIERFQVITR